jgi:hypothetical protein
VVGHPVEGVEVEEDYDCFLAFHFWLILFYLITSRFVNLRGFFENLIFQGNLEHIKERT